MKNRTAFMTFVLSAFFLTLAPAALASNTWYVDGVNGSDSNDCKSSVIACKTIGHAISLCSWGDTIMVAPATYTENLTIKKSLKIIGSDASTTIVDGGGVGTVFSVSNTKGHVGISKLTIRNGTTPYYGCGAGISNEGTLTVIQSTITANSASYCGGGIDNEGTLTVNNSTISGNSAYYYSAGAFGLGGGIYVGSGSATVNNSTISGNGATYNDGAGITVGVYNTTATLTINNSTISGNSAPAGGAIWIYSGSAASQNSVVANNSGGNCSGTFTSNGYNLSSDNTCNFNGPGDMNNTDPKLGTLGNHGGPTQTIPLLSGSPAIDAGNPNGCTDGNGMLLTTDQRGAPRPDPEDTGGCDIGAFERQKD